MTTRGGHTRKAASAAVGEVRFHRYPHLRDIVGLPPDDERSLGEKAAEAVLERIITGEFPPGRRLKCTELAALLGMSRTPVAGGLARLAAEGVLVQPFNHMAVVAPSAARWLIHVHELRQLLEPEAAARAAGRIAGPVKDDLHQLMHDARPARGEAWRAAAMQFDFALHLAIAHFCGNLPMATAIRKCWSFKRLSYGLSDNCRATLRREYLEHGAIWNAVDKGKSTLARSLMTRHLRRAAATRPSVAIV